MHRVPRLNTEHHRESVMTNERFRCLWEKPFHEQTAHAILPAPPLRSATPDGEICGHCVVNGGGKVKDTASPIAAVLYTGGRLDCAMNTGPHSIHAHVLTLIHSAAAIWRSARLEGVGHRDAAAAAAAAHNGISGITLRRRSIFTHCDWTKPRAVFSVYNLETHCWTSNGCKTLSMRLFRVYLDFSRPLTTVRPALFH